MSAFPGGTPTRQALDRVVPDRPAFFVNRDGHGAWVNSRALALAGIDRDHDRPDLGPDRTRTRRRSERHPPRRRDRDRPADPAADDDRGPGRRARARPGVPAPVRDHGLAGRLGGGRGPGCLPLDRRARDPDRPRDRLPLVGPGAGRRADRRLRRTAADRQHRPAALDDREDHGRRGRRELHGGDARAVPRRRPAGRPAIAGSASSTRSCSSGT